MYEYKEHKKYLDEKIIEKANFLLKQFIVEKYGNKLNIDMI